MPDSVLNLLRSWKASLGGGRSGWCSSMSYVVSLERESLTFEDVDGGIQKLKRARVHVFTSGVKGFYVNPLLLLFLL